MNTLNALAFVAATVALTSIAGSQPQQGPGRQGRPGQGPGPMMGMPAPFWTTPEYAKDLQLSNEQRAQIRELTPRGPQGMGPGFGPGGPGMGRGPGGPGMGPGGPGFGPGGPGGPGMGPGGPGGPGMGPGGPGFGPGEGPMGPPPGGPGFGEGIGRGPGGPGGMMRMGPPPMVRVPKEVDEGLREILSKEQYARHQQIVRQLEEPRALTRKAAAKELGLSAEQRCQMFDLLEEAEAERPADLMDQLLAVLSANQKAQWTQLLGEPFELARRQPRR